MKNSFNFIGGNMKVGKLILSLVLVAAVCSLGQAATKVLEWKFDGNLDDSSSNGFNGTAYVNTGASPLSYAAGVSGQALVSDGNQCAYKNAGFDANLAPFGASSHWTVNVWVYPTTSAAGNWKILWNLGSKPNGDGIADSRTLYATSTGMICFNDGGNSNYLSTGMPFDVGQWQMITTTYDGTKIRIYKNGILIGLKNFTFVNALGQLRVPSNAWYGYNFIAGKYDEFSVWNEALTQEEIVNLIIPGVFPDYESVQEKVYYNMDDPNGSTMTLPDHSGNNNTGAFYGFSSPIANWVAPGKKGASLLFDGGQAIDLPAGLSISQNVQHSVAFWFKSGYQPFTTAFYSEQNDTEKGSRLIIRGDAGTNGAIRAYSHDRWYNTQYSLYYDASDYMNSKYWHHFALTADGEKAKMYIDGEVVAEANETNLGSKVTMSGSVGFNWDSLGYLGDWAKTYVDEFHMYVGALSQEQILALMAEGNLNNDFEVDFADFAVFAEDWMANTTTTAGSVLTVDNMEGSLAKWSVVDISGVEPYYTGTGTIASSTNAYAGTKSLQWDYSLPAREGGNYSSIKYDFGTATDLTIYDSLKLFLYREAGNTPEALTNGVVYIKFYNSSSTEPKAEILINGPNSVVDPASKWDTWFTNLNVQLHSGSNYVDKTVLNDIRYIAIGCGSSRSDARTGRIYIDEFTFAKNPICTKYLTTDIDSIECQDCKVNMKDFMIFVEKWLLGTE
jgi:hypothetical protein